MNVGDTRKARHMDALRRALIARQRATRAELAKDTGLTTMTVGKLLGEMQARGEVSQSETGESSGGRPSTIAAYCADYACYAVVSVTQDARGSAFRLSVFDLFGRRVATQAMHMDCVRADSFDAWLGEMVRRFALRLVSFALPGEAQGDHVLFCDFEALVQSDFLPRIRRKFGVATLFENDVNAAVCGHAFGDARGNFAGVYFPGRYAPGAGIMVDGKIVHGLRNFAGEIGFMHGIDAWTRLDYGDREKTLGMITDVLMAISCVVAPEGIVLYGDFFDDEMICAAQEMLFKRLGGQIGTRLMTGELAEDMECGAAQLAHEKLLDMFLEGE